MSACVNCGREHTGLAIACHSNVVQLRPADRAPGMAQEGLEGAAAVILSARGLSGIARALSLATLLLNREIDAAEDGAQLGLVSPTELEEVRARIRGHRHTVDVAGAFLR